MKHKLLWLSLLSTITLFSKSNTELLGDILALSIPTIAYGTTLHKEDKEGQIEFYKAYGTTLGTAIFLKAVISEDRPDKSNNRSFPSGHTASAISGATFIHKRYGLKYAIPAYLGAVYTGYSRVHSEKHFSHDVLAGAVLGAVSSWYFVTSYKKIELKPMLSADFQGLKLSYKF